MFYYYFKEWENVDAGCTYEVDLTVEHPYHYDKAYIEKHDYHYKFPTAIPTQQDEEGD